jgi:hypothetical protein
MGPRVLTYAEVYGYRTRKPGAILGLPIIGRHWGYVGQTRRPAVRHLEHMTGRGRYNKGPANWADLDPERYVLFSLNHFPQWMLNGVELFFIFILLPVYNHKGNLGNPRRIRLVVARRHRYWRAKMRMRWTPTFRQFAFWALASMAFVIGVLR